MSEPDETIDDLLRQVPEGTPELLDAAELMALRAGQLPDGHAASIEARLADDTDARGLFAELDPDADERQLRRAVEAGMREPEPVHPPPRRWPWAFGGGALALAAAMVLVFVRPGIVELPPYALSASPGVAQQRGEGKPTGVFRPQTMLELVITPERAVEPAPRLTAFVSRPKGPLTAVKVSTKQGLGGAWRVSAPAAQWFTPGAGRWRAHVAVVPVGVPLNIGPKTTLETAKDAHPDVRWLTAEVIYQPETR